MIIFYHVVLIFSYGTSFASIFYVAFAIYVVALGRNRNATANIYSTPVTVFKPLCGLDPNLYENLRSFCDQSYPEFQILFGVRDANDPAVEVVERVIADYPERDLTLVVESRTIGTNYKVCSLANMARYAKHEILVIADSDMRVEPNYLSTVVAPFGDAKVGAVTCLYKGTPVDGWTSVLGTMFVNEWFLPSVMVALSGEKLCYCFGATMAVRVNALRAIGGFEALAFDLADDHMLGKRISECGYEVRLAPYVVENVVLEPDLKSLFWHELRWARTVRSVRPIGYALSFVTYALPASILLLLVTHFSSLSTIAFVLALGLRMVLHYVVRAVYRLRGPSMPWLMPIRDLLSFAVWCASFLGRNVRWRDSQFYLKPDGRLALLEGKPDL